MIRVSERNILNREDCRHEIYLGLVNWPDTKVRMLALIENNGLILDHGVDA